MRGLINMGKDADPISGIAQGAGNVMAAQAQAGALKEQAAQQLKGQEEQLAEQKAEFGTTNEQRQKAYAEAIARGQQGEQQLIGESNTPNAMLNQESQDIASRNAQELQQGAGQMSANLAAQGVRGGQAATLMNRGTGQQAISAQQNINQMKFQDEATRKNQLRAYMAAKAGGQTPGMGVSI